MRRRVFCYVVRIRMEVGRNGSQVLAVQSLRLNYLKYFV